MTCACAMRLRLSRRVILPHAWGTLTLPVLLKQRTSMAWQGCRVGWSLLEAIRLRHRVTGSAMHAKACPACCNAAQGFVITCKASLGPSIVQQMVPFHTAHGGHGVLRTGLMLCCCCCSCCCLNMRSKIGIIIRKELRRLACMVHKKASARGMHTYQMR